jgi:hypothetical protein
MSEFEALGASFRDPAGYVIEQQGRIKRVVTGHGRQDYRKLISSGLYARLSDEDLLVRHREEPRSPSWPHDIEAVLLPEIVPFVSYPYEWSFGQLKDAALLTLRVQELSQEHGMSLKDASAFNVQFRGVHPLFIDTLSFHDDDGGPWPGYSQFCRHFLAPLLMMRHVWPQAGAILRVALDGLPLDFVSAALPWQTYLDFGCLVHIHWHARSQKKHRHAVVPAPTSGRLASNPKGPIIASLRSMVEDMQPAKPTTGWTNYYAESKHYSSEAEAAKRQAVSVAIERTRANLVYDLGGNTGAYSRLAAASCAYCVSLDLDPACVQHNYTETRRLGVKNLLPLVVDLSNPSPGLGFASCERMALEERPPADLLLALALVHHLRIAANVPFARIAEYFARLGKALLIEWTPKHDPKVAELLQSRPDTFHDYHEAGFQQAFGRHFQVEQSMPLPGSDRIIYLMRRGSRP